MYPNDELNQLELRKVVLRGSISVNRSRCVASAHRVSQPLQWVDRGVDQWRRLSPMVKFGAMPLGFLVKKLFFPKSRVVGSFGSLLKWAPAIVGAFRAFKSMRSTGSDS